MFLGLNTASSFGLDTRAGDDFFHFFLSRVSENKRCVETVNVPH